MATFEIISKMYLWFAQELIGNEILAGLVVAGVLYTILVSINLPPKTTFAFMIPIAIGLIGMSYLTWFGWLIIGIAGMIFGSLVYKLYEG